MCFLPMFDEKSGFGTLEGQTLRFSLLLQALRNSDGHGDGGADQCAGRHPAIRCRRTLAGSGKTDRLTPKSDDRNRRRVMNKLLLNSTMALAIVASPAGAAELTVITAGDQNMVDYINDYLGPLFEQQNPGNTVRAVGTSLALRSDQAYLGYPDPLIDTEFVADDCPPICRWFG